MASPPRIVDHYATTSARDGENKNSRKSKFGRFDGESSVVVGGWDDAEGEGWTIDYTEREWVEA